MHLGWILVIGSAFLSMALLPALLAGRPFSLPLVYVLFGTGVFALVDPLRGPNPTAAMLDNSVVLYATEFVVIVSLATVGLSIERRPGLVSWSAVWRLLAITMPLCVGAAALLGSQTLGLGLAGAVLLGAVLAPTDPVLADDVQVPGPQEHPERDEVRFTLTAEAGLNDSLAFPVTHLAIALAASSWGDTWQSWLVTDVIYRIVVGALAGLITGRVLTTLARRWRAPIVSSSGVGVFVLGATLLVYGATELVGGYGFLAVFVAALSRHDESDDLRVHLHGFAEQVEAILIAVALIGLGGAIAEGLLSPISLAMIGTVVVFLMVIRPLFGFIGLVGTPVVVRERAAIGFLGIRGIGSVYYLAYATASGAFGQEALDIVWATTALTILGSVLLHGTTAPWIMRHLDRKNGEVPART